MSAVTAGASFLEGRKQRKKKVELPPPPPLPAPGLDPEVSVDAGKSERKKFKNRFGRRSTVKAGNKDLAALGPKSLLGF